jgi:release factor glutamine methyltransferase
MRLFSAYEQNQLTLHHISEAEAQKHREKPVEYITGHVTFCGHDFLVSPDVLIPRIETEELVAQAVAICAQLSENDGKPLSVADIGTGSGAIGISLALAAQSKKIKLELSLSDISEPSLAIAKQNSQRLLSEQPIFLISDLLAAYEPATQFDLLIANLPYIPTSRIPTLDESVISYEPHLALDGGPSGLTLIAAFLSQAVPHLTPQGVILLEIDHTQAKSIPELEPKLTCKVLLDSFNRPRFACLQLAA